jgi:acetylornithine deacetylase/succinyl-diaminopimelate desuccinylase-like protein
VQADTAQRVDRTERFGDVLQFDDVLSHIRFLRAGAGTLLGGGGGGVGGGLPAPEPRGGPPSPLTDEVLRPIERLTAEMWPGVPVVPVMGTGATDGRQLRQGGIPTYGVSGLFGDMDDSRAHGRDERVLIKSFYDGQEFLYRLVKELSGKRPVS